MKSLKFIVLLLFTVGMVYLLNNPIQTGKSKIPALGKFLSPYTGFWQQAESTSPNFDNYNFSNLKQPVSVKYDEKLVPHIFGKNNVDVAFVQGFVTAKHRLWQMEFQTHMAAGRLSETIGSKTINLDKKMRRLGLKMGAEKTIKKWKERPDTYKLLQAYSDGVNAYIQSLNAKNMPLEYKLMGYSPEEWTPFKTALLLKLMAYTLCIRESDVEMTNALAHFRRDTFDLLYPDNDPTGTPIIPKGTNWAFKKKTATKNDKKSRSINKKLSFNTYEKPYEGIGSNNWAVSGKKTASGSPILCNDPHLKLSLPSIWYELQLHSPTTNVYGVSLPGAPGVIIGFNEHIAWGITNVGMDVADWYTVEWKDHTKTSYLLDGEYADATLKIEEIKVAGQATIQDTIRHTIWGPVAYSDKNHPKFDLALRWSAHDGSDELTTFEKLNKAKNYADYKEAISTYECPPQNFAFADRAAGDIAIWVQGKFPIREKEQGRFVQDGSNSANKWEDFVPKDQNPHVRNPERGFVSSANQKSTDADYPYYYTGQRSHYRGRIINSRLEAMDGISVEDMMKLQTDNYSLKAEESLPLMLNKLDKSLLTKKEVAYYKIISDWDYHYQKDAVGASIFHEWWTEFYRQTWDEFKPLEASNSFKKPVVWKTIQLLRDDPQSIFFDIQRTTAKESAIEIANFSFKDACAKVNAWERENEKSANWTDYQGTKIDHLARIKAFGEIDVPIGGDRSSINAVSKQNGPSWRMIVDLDKEVKAFGVYPGGQSGNPGSPYYDNFIAHWAAGKYYPIIFPKNEQEEIENLLGTEIYQQ